MKGRFGSEATAVATAALTSVVLWASAFVAIRYAGRQLGPGPLALARLLVGSLGLSVAMVITRTPLPSRRAMFGAVASGVLWFGIYNLALNAAERRIDAGTASLLVNTGPIFIAVIAGVALHEGFPRWLIVGSAVSFAGVVLIGVGASRHGLQATWGAALCVIAALAYASAIVLQKPAMKHGSALSITWLACLVGAIVCLPYAASLVDQLGHARTSTITWTVYLGLGPTAIGFATWGFALARTSAGRLGVTTYLVPPLAVLLGWALLSETPALLAVPGGILCLAGVALTRRGSTPATSTPAASTPATSTSAASTPVAGTPAARTPIAGTPAGTPTASRTRPREPLRTEGTS